MFIAKDLNLHFSSQTIFDDISFNLSSYQRVGLVGRNGSGKTTLLKAIAGIQGLDSGEIVIQKDKTMAYLPQNVVLLSNKSVLTECLNTFEPLKGSSDYLGDLIQESLELEKKLDDNDHEMVEHYALLHNKLAEFDYQIKIVEAKRILLGLGFLLEQLDSAVSTLSVGWKMRLVLAKLLLLKADFYIFDEPTNHLDLVAKDWFLNFLKNSNFGFMLVCHDRYFLDELCSNIYEISLGQLKVYDGNYSSYLNQKKHNESLLEKQYVEQQKFLKKEKALIERFRASATKAKMVQSRLKALDKIEIIKLDRRPKTMRFSLPPVKRSGKIVLSVKNLSKSFNGKHVFENISFEINRGEKVAIVAPNGKGKSTILNIVMSKLEKDSGSFEFGHNVLPAFFEQDQNKSLSQRNDLLYEVESACRTTEQRQKVRAMLGAFLFSGDDVEKKVSVLSGGEKNRVAMVKVLLQNANFLILDEPTNHLDIESKEVLLNVLKKFDGTILFVSHDRDFLNHLATSVIDLQETSSHKYSGNYDSFLDQTKQVKDSENVVKSKEKDAFNYKKKNAVDYKMRKKLSNLESRINRQERDLKLITKQFELLEYGTSEYQTVFNNMQNLEKKLNENLNIWESILSKFDN